MREDERKFVEELEQIKDQFYHSEIPMLLAIIRRQEKVIEKAKAQRRSAYYNSDASWVALLDQYNKELDAIE